MKLVQFWKDNAPALGIQTEQGIVDTTEEAMRRGFVAPANMMDLIQRSETMYDLLKLMTNEPQCFTNAPLAPAITGMGRILCIGLNYRRHAAECGMEPPAAPSLFNKFPNTLSAHGGTVVLHPQYHNYDYEAELVVVMGKAARDVSEEDALNYVFGYTCGNDLSARDLQFSRSNQWLLGKTLDGFAPIGPCIVTSNRLNPSDLAISCAVNGEVRQNSRTSDLIFSIPALIADLSRHFTLEPGDVIFTGTPEGVIHGYPEEKQVWLKAGDRVDVTIEGIGTLTTHLA